MDNIIRQLTHNNDLFEEQWCDISTRIEQASIPDDSQLVLQALADYVLTEPMDPLPSYIKYIFIELVIKQLMNNEASITITDLVNIFTRILDRSSTNEWNLEFLKVMYEDYKIAEQLCVIPLKTNLIEQILRSLEKKTFVFDNEDVHDKWKCFLTEYVFSSSSDNDNILNKECLITNMQTHFQQFYQHAVQHSKQSPIWLHIAETLYESSPTIFRLTTITNEMPITSGDINQLIRLYQNNPELIKTNSSQLLAMSERLILANNYDDAHLLFTKIIIPNLSSLDLESFLRQLIQLCPIVEHRDSFCAEILSFIIRELDKSKFKKNFASLFFDFLLAILKLHIIHAPDLARVLLKRNDFYPWNELLPGVVELIKICISYDTIINEEFFGDLNNLEDIIDFIAEKAKVYPNILKALHPIALEAILRWANPEAGDWSHHVYRMGTSMFKLIDREQINEDLCTRFIHTIQNQVNSKNEQSKNKNRLFLMYMTNQLGDYIEQLKRLSTDVHAQLATLFLSLLGCPLYDEDQNMTFEHVALANTLFKTASGIFNETDARLYKPCLNRMYNNAKQDDMTILYQWWTGFWLITGMRLSNVAIDHLEQFLERTFNDKDMSLIGLLVTLCSQRPGQFANHFDDLINTLLSDQGQYLSSILTLFILVTNQHPEIVLSKHIDQIFASLETLPFNNDLCMFIQALRPVVNYHPDLFDIHQEKLFRLIMETQNLLIFYCYQRYILSSVLINDETKAHYHFNRLIELLKNKNCSQPIRKEILHTCLLIGLKYKQVLINRRQDLGIFDTTLLLHYIDDTVVSELDQTIIKRARDDLQQIQLSIDRAIIDRKDGKVDMNLGNVPAWGSAVAKLLNHRSNNDWRLLGQQLGYSPSEIKHWAMQNDPCIALLREWFVTHTVEDAVCSLVKVLSEIDRHDAEKIIRQAVSTTGPVIAANYSCHLKRLPPIFLSYHSSEQTLVTKLKDHLGHAGYACQMDDEQTDLNTMETAIRGSKIVVCCINTLYSQSENCSKVFQTILSMKKAFVLIVTEEETWSPSDGIFKYILRDYSYIQFVDRKTSDGWSEKKFIELLGQIRYHVAPDHDTLSAEYHHWFVPRLDNLIFLKSSNKHEETTSISLDGILLIVLHPQIILSYQWDSQKDVLQLYKQLTQLGYRIGLDIFQMGGGDTLREKYSIAIRHALCLLVCITPKYMKSMNCQHEISLANASNKPVVPLLLEETNPWPPAHLVTSVFADKPYIDFRYSNGNDRWSGKQYEVLLAHLKQLVPNVHTDKPRHLLDMQRPVSASRNNDLEKRLTRISSAPIIPNSRACSLM